MSSTVVALWAMFMLGAASMFGVMKFSEEPLVAPAPRVRKREVKKQLVEEEEETLHEWLGVMKDDTADSLDLMRYRYIWLKKRNPLRAIGARVQRLAITAKPQVQVEMASIKRHMKSRPKPITGRKVLAARRRQ